MNTKELIEILETTLNMDSTKGEEIKAHLKELESDARLYRDIRESVDKGSFEFGCEQADFFIDTMHSMATSEAFVGWFGINHHMEVTAARDAVIELHDDYYSEEDV